MKICFITGSRADYGLLSSLMKIVKKEKNFNFQLIVTGSHLSKEHGHTYKEIIKDKFKVNFFVNIGIGKKDKPLNICNSVSEVVKKISKNLDILKPDLIVLLGDRYEIFASSIAAYILQIPICHIHGGELTRGSIDDSFRHSITKMSNIHLVATKSYAKRIKQLGENPKNIFVVGGFGVDLIKRTKLLNKQKLEKNLGLKFKKKNILVTYHPETIKGSNPKKDFSEILKAIKSFKDVYFIFTKVNADANGLIINKMIDNFVKKNKSRCSSFISMGQLNYLSTIQIVDGVLGNSSSGVMEVPTFKKATINVGLRQTDRIKGQSVINIDANSLQITKTLKKIFSKNFNKSLITAKNPYGNGGASKESLRIFKNLKKIKYKQKKFFDIKY
jgi:GDP/UDP-N,N'-diacetylbacillosamine 2-epimerase (hydrolysing)